MNRNLKPCQVSQKQQIKICNSVLKNSTKYQLFKFHLEDLEDFRNSLRLSSFKCYNKLSLSLTLTQPLKFLPFLFTIQGSTLSWCCINTIIKQIWLCALAYTLKCNLFYLLSFSSKNYYNKKIIKFYIFQTFGKD